MPYNAKDVLRAADLPPVWLLGHLALLRALSGFGPSWPLPLSGLLVAAAGVALMAWAAATMVRARTTFWPGRAPAALVTSGPFRLSRNPIYLGDVLVLLGAILWQGKPAGLLLVPLLVAILARRFISPEEARTPGGVRPRLRGVGGPCSPLALNAAGRLRNKIAPARPDRLVGAGREGDG